MQAPLAQITWCHNIALLEKLKSNEELRRHTSKKVQDMLKSFSRLSFRKSTEVRLCRYNVPVERLQVLFAPLPKSFDSVLRPSCYGAIYCPLSTYLNCGDRFTSCFVLKLAIKISVTSRMVLSISISPKGETASRRSEIL